MRVRILNRVGVVSRCKLVVMKIWMRSWGLKKCFVFLELLIHNILKYILWQTCIGIGDRSLWHLPTLT